MKLEKWICAGLAAVMLVGPLPILALADPPPWAPAHGWRRRHDRSYVGYNGYKWPHDFDVLRGACNRAEIGAVLGGALGGAVGSTVGKGNTRVVATVLGAVAGAVIGQEVGREMDERDRACFGHALELAESGKTVRWTNPDARLDYALTPTRSFDVAGHPCRDFTLVTTHHGSPRSTTGGACRSDDGVWRLD